MKIKYYIALLALMLCGYSIFAQSGNFNDDVSWTLQTDGTLIVVGHGNIDGVKEKKAPFVKRKIADKIQNIDLTRFRGKVGKNTFLGIRNIKAIRVKDKEKYEFDELAFDHNVTIESLEFVSNNYKEKDYRVCFNYIPAFENMNCGDMVYWRDSIKRTIAIRDKHLTNNPISIKGDFTGRGTRVWSNSSNGMRIYHGDWVNGQMQGHGIAVMFDGSIKMGLWDDNLFKGSPEVVTLNEFLEFPEILPFDLIAQIHVVQAVNKWQLKDEFETVEEWSARVTEANRKEYATYQYKLLVDKYVENAASKTSINLRLGAYDSENSTYIVYDSAMGAMPVALSGSITPQQFKESWNSIVKVPTYYFDGEKIAIWDIIFWSKGKLVGYFKKDAQLRHDNIDINYAFDPIDIPQFSKRNRRNTTPSDVDINIPSTKRKNDTSFVFIIANENYDKVQEVPFALNDGNIFALYCERTLGIDHNHIKIYPNATYGSFLECMGLIKQTTEAYDGEVKVIFYYAGHAFPDESNKTAYLLPIDGNPLLPETGYGLHRLYSELGQLEARQIICFMDACFSGATRENDMLVASRGVMIKVKEESPTGRMVVFTSSASGEPSLQYGDKQHGMFTYFFLKALQESKGDITLGELSEQVTRDVKRNSSLINQKLQTPQTNVSPQLLGNWQNIKL